MGTKLIKPLAWKEGYEALMIGLFILAMFTVLCLITITYRCCCRGKFPPSDLDPESGISLSSLKTTPKPSTSSSRPATSSQPHTPVLGCQDQDLQSVPSHVQLPWPTHADRWCSKERQWSYSWGIVILYLERKEFKECCGIGMGWVKDKIGDCETRER